MPLIDLSRQMTNKGDVSFNSTDNSKLKWAYNRELLDSSVTLTGGTNLSYSDPTVTITVSTALAGKIAVGSTVSITNVDWDAGITGDHTVTSVDPATGEFTLSDSGLAAVSTSTCTMTSIKTGSGFLSIVDNSGSDTFSVDPRSGNVFIGGDLSLTGSGSFVDSSSISFEDSVLTLGIDANDNPVEDYVTADEVAGWRIGVSGLDPGSNQTDWPGLVYHGGANPYWKFWNKSANTAPLTVNKLTASAVDAGSGLIETTGAMTAGGVVTGGSISTSGAVDAGSISTAGSLAGGATTLGGTTATTLSTPSLTLSDNGSVSVSGFSSDLSTDNGAGLVATAAASKAYIDAQVTGSDGGLYVTKKKCFKMTWVGANSRFEQANFHPHANFRSGDTSMTDYGNAEYFKITVNGIVTEPDAIQPM